MKKFVLLLNLILITSLSYNTQAQSHSKKEKKAENIFLKHSDEALQIMQKKAADMEVTGVAMVFYIPGDSTQSWISKMKVAGKLSDEGSNYLAIASSKAADMADTFKNSGSREEPKRGELGYIGGVIHKIDSGYLLASFSGGSGEQDAVISTNGLNFLSSNF